MEVFLEKPNQSAKLFLSELELLHRSPCWGKPPSEPSLQLLRLSSYDGMSEA